MKYDLVEAKKLLADFLGIEFKIYLQLLKSWFHKKITKEDFDHQARKLLSTSSVYLHNNFLLALLSKCRTPSNSSNAKSYNKQDNRSNNVLLAVPNTGFFQCHLPVDVLSQVSQVKLQPIEQDDANTQYMATDIFLPDTDFLYGRLIVTAWEFGLQTIDDDCALILLEAIYIMLKNIMTCLVQNNSTFQLHQNKFIHSFGAVFPDQKQDSTLYEIENSDDSLVIPSKKPRNEINCDILKNQVLQVDMFDLLNVFHKDKYIIPSHTILTLNHERIINRMCHPTIEELEQTQKINSIKNCKQTSNIE